MAHRIVGLDLGARRVKAAIVEKKLRTAAVIGFDSEPVAAPFDDDAREAALTALLRRIRQPDDVWVSGLPATMVLHRVLSFPFQDAKALRESAPFELETHVPVDLETSIVDQVLIERSAEGCTALVVAAPRARVEERLALLRRVGAEPRQLGLTALSQARLLQRLPSLAQGSTLLLDVGTDATEAVLVRDGQARDLRVISVGAEAVRSGFTDQFDVGVASDGDLLASHALLLAPAMAPSSPDEAALHAATLRAIGPWLRELRQTLAAFRRGGKPAPDRIVLTGGMAALRGLPDALEGMLGLPVALLPLHELELGPLPALVRDRLGDQGATAVALALEGAEAAGGEIMDFRQGDLNWEGDYAFLREKVPTLVTFAVVALCLLAVKTALTYRGLLLEQQQQQVALVELAQRVTGKKIQTLDKLQAELRRPVQVELAGYYPDLSAIRVLDEITRAIEEVTEPPDFRPPGGPAEAAPPGTSLAQVVAPMPQLRGVPPLGMVPTESGRGGIDTGAAAALRRRALPPPADTPAAGGDSGPRGAEGDDGGGGGEAAQAKGAFEGHKVELLSVDIDRTKGNLRGDCDTQEALLAFQTRLEKIPCLRKIKSTSDRITFERHRDWFRFQVGFEIQCATEPAKTATKGKPAAEDDSADGADDSETP